MYTPVNPTFTIQKWGLKGSKLYRYVFVMPEVDPFQEADKTILAVTSPESVSIPCKAITATFNVNEISYVAKSFQRRHNVTEYRFYVFVTFCVCLNTCYAI